MQEFEVLWKLDK